MALQTEVKIKLASGVVGDLYDDSLNIVDSYVLSNGGVGTVGGAVTTADGETVAMGGTDTFAGILGFSKQYANYNISLGASNDVADGTQVSVIKEGRVFVDLGGVAAYDSDVYFVDATGALGAGTAGAGQTQIPNCKVIVPAEANGLAVIELR
jgi:hypothetical protein